MSVEISVDNNVQPEEYKEGTYWQSSKRELFILGCFRYKTTHPYSFVAICLKDGGFWTDPSRDPFEAVNGLNQFRGKLTITVK